MFYTYNILIFSILFPTPPDDISEYGPKSIAFIIYYKYLCESGFAGTWGS